MYKTEITKTEPKALLNVWVPKATLRGLKRVASLSGTSKSSVVRVVLGDYVDGFNVIGTKNKKTKKRAYAKRK